MRAEFRQRRFIYIWALIAVQLFGSEARVWAEERARSARECRAFKSADAKAFFETTYAVWQQSDQGNGVMQTIVRATVSELVANTDWNQKTKAQFWRDVIRQLQAGPGRTFIAFEYEGTDGSIVFNGGKPGAALVIRINGDVYRGTLIREYVSQGTKRLWKADYSTLTLLKP